MKSPNVSIIVPVYNVEKYLPCCIDSLLNKTLKDIEIILVEVVVKDAPDNVTVAGVPAKIISLKNQGRYIQNKCKTKKNNINVF